MVQFSISYICNHVWVWGSMFLDICYELNRVEGIHLHYLNVS